MPQLDWQACRFSCGSEPTVCFIAEYVVILVDKIMTTSHLNASTGLAGLSLYLRFPAHRVLHY
jgi:hypothetical protein